MQHLSSAPSLPHRKNVLAHSSSLQSLNKTQGLGGSATLPPVICYNQVAQKDTTDSLKAHFLWDQTYAGKKAASCHCTLTSTYRVASCLLLYAG